jgi:hypothetical protein
MMAMMCKGLELPLCKRDGNIKWDKFCSTAPIQRTLTGTPMESRDTESKIHLPDVCHQVVQPCALMSSGGLAGLATQRLNEVVYCSRFFDLNDEVEQELAAEEDDFLSINISASQQENYEDQRKQFKVTSAIEQTAKSSSHSSSLAPQSQSLEFAPQIQVHTPGTKVQIFKSNSKRRTGFQKGQCKFRASGKE